MGQAGLLEAVHDSVSGTRHAHAREVHTLRLGLSPLDLHAETYTEERAPVSS
jgi:hypothetical protein